MHCTRKRTTNRIINSLICMKRVDAHVNINDVTGTCITTDIRGALLSAAVKMHYFSFGLALHRRG